MSELRRGAVRIVAAGGEVVAPHHTRVEVWAGDVGGWIRVCGVAAIRFEIEAGGRPTLGALTLTMFPSFVDIAADPGQIVLREALT